ncbi:MAG: tetratricopeptide repeat protein [Anaerolineae bacterium]|nr:tetratricopeptide repeat protein [Anaerolineae bacterium]
MSDAMRNQLEQAYNLIQNDRLDDAVGLLRPIVRADPNNPDAWWLLANAVSDPNDAFEALNNVMRLEPNHEQARDLLDNLLQEYPELASRMSRPADTSMTSSSSGLRSTKNITPTPAPTDSAGTSWDTQFGDSNDFNFSSTDAAPAVPNNEIDDFFSTLDPSATTSDFDSAGTSFETGFADNDFERPSAAAKRATTEADLDSLFSSDDDSEDMDTLFASSRGEAVTTDDVTADNDLDAMFATSTSHPADRASSDNALQDPFGSAEPDFLQDIDTTPAAPAEPNRGRGASSSKVATRTSGVIPAQDPFAAEARVNKGQPSRNLLIGGIVVVVLAGILLAVALLRPFSTPTDQTATATVGVALNNGGSGQLSISEAVQQVLTQASFDSPTVAVADNKLSVKLCEKPSRNLRTRIYTAMDVIANTTVIISKQVGSAELELVDCAQDNARLYRATAPIAALEEYIQGNRADVAKYRAAWVQN